MNKDKEEIIIEGKRNLTVIPTFIIIAIIIGIVLSIYTGNINDLTREEQLIRYSEHFPQYMNRTTVGCWVFVILSIIYNIILSLSKITVTNKRVYGKTPFGKSVDLPIDSISAVEKTWFNGVGVSTSSGFIKFYLLSNNKEIHKEITNLLINRQNNKSNKDTKEKSDYIEELKNLKKLLDEGIITQEEFDKKKKELL